MEKDDINSLIELQKKAQELVSELDNIKKASKIYEEAGISLSDHSGKLKSISSDISNLIDNFLHSF